MEPLADPLNDRIIKSVPAPPHRPLQTHHVYTVSDGTLPDWKFIMSCFHKGGRIDKATAMRITRDTIEVFKKEENIVKVADPVIFVGDIHG